MSSHSILALDMAGGEIAVCVLHDGASFFSSALPEQGKMRSTAIVPLMNDVLLQAGIDWHQLNGLALGAGPGSFTGLRIASATLAGINSALKLPVIHLSSLAITARQVDHDGPLWVLEDARAGEAFVGCFVDQQARQADACRQWTDVEELTPSYYCCFAEPPVDLPGWKRLPLLMSRSAALVVETQAACQQTIDWPLYPSPRYLQLSQAERNAHV